MAKETRNPDYIVYFVPNRKNAEPVETTPALRFDGFGLFAAFLFFVRGLNSFRCVYQTVTVCPVPARSIRPDKSWAPVLGTCG